MRSVPWQKLCCCVFSLVALVVLLGSRTASACDLFSTVTIKCRAYTGRWSDPSWRWVNDSSGFSVHCGGAQVYPHPSDNCSPPTVHGEILQKYRQLAGSSGFLGLPLTDEIATSDGRGRYTAFQNGFIYWSPTTGAYAIYGYVYWRWRELGAESSWLGFPITDELAHPDGVGRYSLFEGGAVYWSWATGAREKYGDVERAHMALRGRYTGDDALNAAVNAALNTVISDYGKTQREHSIGIIRYEDGSFDVTASQRGTTDGKGGHRADFHTGKANIPKDAKLVGTAHSHPDGTDGPEGDDLKSPLPLWVIDPDGNRWHVDPKTKKVTKLPKRDGPPPSHNMPGHRPIPINLNGGRFMGVPLWESSLPPNATPESIVQIAAEGAAILFTTGGVIEYDPKTGSTGSSGVGSSFWGFVPSFW
jgi:hypothetical protein